MRAEKTVPEKSVTPRFLVQDHAEARARGTETAPGGRLSEARAWVRRDRAIEEKVGTVRELAGKLREALTSGVPALSRRCSQKPSGTLPEPSEEVAVYRDFAKSTTASAAACRLWNSPITASALETVEADPTLTVAVDPREG